jgi:hypothetical protein
MLVAHPHLLTPGSRKRALSSATDPPVPKKVATRLSSPLDSDDESELICSTIGPNESFSDEHVPSLVDNDDTDDYEAGQGEPECGDTTQMVCKFTPFVFLLLMLVFNFRCPKVNVLRTFALYLLALLKVGSVTSASESPI